MTKLWQTLRYLKSLTKHPLTQKTGGSLKRLFCYQLAKRLLPNTGFIVPFVGDVKLMLGSGMPTAAANYYCGLNEFDDMGFLLHFLHILILVYILLNGLFLENLGHFHGLQLILAYLLFSLRS